ncbi:MAG: hypothetical protein AAGD28_18350 [Bacteroidota bacterium]
MLQVQSKKEAEGLLNELRSLLRFDDSEEKAEFVARIDSLQEEIRDEELFEEKIKPHFEKNIAYLQENFPDLFSKYLATAIKAQIRDSQDEIIDALYPIIGKLIAKYIRAEIDRISQRVDDRLDDPFANLRFRVKAFFSGVSYQEMLMREGVLAVLEEIFVIRKEDGLLMGHFSLNDVSHPDMIAGMLTGIKSFIEHAFEKTSQELETLEYESYTILIFNFKTFYFAAVEKGPIKAEFKEKLQNSIFAFCEKNDVITDQSLNKAVIDSLSLELKEHFYGFNQLDK